MASHGISRMSVLALMFPFTAWGVGSVVAFIGAIGCGVPLLLVMQRHRHFGKDPLGGLRRNHTQVAKRLKHGALIGEEHHIDFADLADSGDDE